MSRPAPARPAAAGTETEAPAGALSVAELTSHIKGLLEGAFSAVRVYGEVIGLTRARSGYVYFTLKDDAGGRDA